MIAMRRRRPPPHSRRRRFRAWRGPRCVGAQAGRGMQNRSAAGFFAHRPGVAPRRSSDGKGRAQSPHPACGRFEAAHCAAHLAKISAFGPASATKVATQPPRARSLQRDTEDRITRNAPLRHCRSCNPDDPTSRPSRSRPPAAIAAGAALLARSRRTIASRRAHRAAPVSPHRTPGRIRAGKNHETHAVQRHPGRGTPGGDRRRPEARRPRHRVRKQGTTQEQHLQGGHHPRRAEPRGVLRRLRRRAPRLPAVQGNRAAVREGRPRRRRRRRQRSRTSSAKAWSSSSRSTRTSAATRAPR